MRIREFAPPAALLAAVAALGAVRLFTRGWNFILLFAQFICAVTALYLLLGSLERRGKLQKTSRLLRLLIRIGAAVFGVSFAAIISLILINSGSDDTSGARYVIVAGAGVDGTEPSPVLRRRLDRAADILRQNPEAVAILCGGYTQGDRISECAAMNGYLAACGISSERLIEEPDSHDTAENIKNAGLIIDSVEGEGRHDVVIVSSYYHVYRCGLLADRYGMNARTASAEFSLGDWPGLVREYFSFLLYIIESTGIVIDTSALGL